MRSLVCVGVIALAISWGLNGEPATAGGLSPPALIHPQTGKPLISPEELDSTRGSPYIEQIDTQTVEEEEALSAPMAAAATDAGAMGLMIDSTDDVQPLPPDRSEQKSYTGLDITKPFQGGGSRAHEIPNDIGALDLSLPDQPRNQLSAPCGCDVPQTVPQLVTTLAKAASLRGEARRAVYDAAHSAAQRMHRSGLTTSTASLLLDGGRTHIYGAPSATGDLWLGKAENIPSNHWVWVLTSQATPNGPMALVWYAGHMGKDGGYGEQQFVGWVYVSKANAGLTPQRSAPHAGHPFKHPPREAPLWEPLPAVVGIRSPREETTTGAYGA